MTHDDIETRIRRHISAFKAVRDAVDLAEKTVNTADRERIAELERDNNALREAFSERDEMYRASVAERDELRHNLAQNAAITETLRAELGTLKGAQEQAKQDTAEAGARMFKAPTPVVEEEQGPWVIYDGGDMSGEPFAGAGSSTLVWDSKLERVNPFSDRALAEEMRRGSTYADTSRVITLAEARRITGAK